MDAAIVTGADSRFGDSVIRTLLKMGFRVHALGQNPDTSAYNERYVIPHAYGTGKLVELKQAVEEALRTEGRLDLLIGIGGPEVTTGWEHLSPEALVRRLHACLTEPLLAANLCLPSLLASKGFLIHGHRRPVARDMTVSPGYFEDSLRQAYDDLFIRNAENGLRSARILYAYPDEEPENTSLHGDVPEAVARAFEIILRQKETCVVREMHISPRGLAPATGFPNLVPGVDPYQTTVLPEEGDEEKEPILIPTEKPRHYVQIAELKDVTNGEEDPAADAAWEEDQEDEPRDAGESSGGGRRRKRPPRKKNRSKKKPEEDGTKESDDERAKDEAEPPKDETERDHGTTATPETDETPEKTEAKKTPKTRTSKKTTARKARPRKRARKSTTRKTGESSGAEDPPAPQVDKEEHGDKPPPPETAAP